LEDEENLTNLMEIAGNLTGKIENGSDEQAKWMEVVFGSFHGF
jgi:hypothetical protein